ncbi:hypothetical protein HD806DRAFT_546805 [Xylariaceae sp. AK1471]|nr:hypothetical protein HD806DRAFT_546805 [Xylariaceae sp. AK1471]
MPGPDKSIAETGFPVLNVLVDIDASAMARTHGPTTDRTLGGSGSDGGSLYPADPPHGTLMKSQQSNLVPTTALQLLDLDAGQVVETKGKRYFAISYVWSMLSDADAVPFLMQLGQELGFQYAWIDRLCIDQNSTIDKLKQLLLMGGIYSEAEVTVILMNSMDSRAMSDAESREAVLSHPWWSRGWTFQEGLLARMSVIRLKATWMQTWQLEGKSSEWDWMDTNLARDSDGWHVKYIAPNARVPWSHIRLALGSVTHDRLYGTLELLPQSKTARMPVSYAMSEAQIIGNFVAAGLMGAECLLGPPTSHRTEVGRCWLPATIEGMADLSQEKIDWEMSFASDRASVKGLLIENENGAITSGSPAGTSTNGN